MPGIICILCARYIPIAKFFDNIDQDLLMRAVNKHAQDKWVVLYIQRWLKAPAQDEDGQLVPRQKGTPQGGGVPRREPYELRSSRTVLRESRW